MSRLNSFHFKFIIWSERTVFHKNSKKMLQLYYTIGSPPSRAVLHVIRLLGLDVEVKNVDLVHKKEQLTPEYLKINPMHQVPALVDGDFALVESRAIMTYLVNSRHPGNELYPNDPKMRALIDQRLYFDAINFFELMASILRPVFFFGNEDIPADKIAKLKVTLELLESFLETNLYLAGNRPTLADVSILSAFIMFQNTFTNYGALPKINGWYERCKSLTGFDENVAGGKAIRDMMAVKGMLPISLN